VTDSLQSCKLIYVKERVNASPACFSPSVSENKILVCWVIRIKYSWSMLVWFGNPLHSSEAASRSFFLLSLVSSGCTPLVSSSESLLGLMTVVSSFPVTATFGKFTFDVSACFSLGEPSCFVKQDCSAGWFWIAAHFWRVDCSSEATTPVYSPSVSWNWIWRLDVSVWLNEHWIWALFQLSNYHLLESRLDIICQGSFISWTLPLSGPEWPGLGWR